MVPLVTRNRPPGITIFPALRRCRGSPAALRSLFVKRGGAGAGAGGGDGDGDGDEIGLREPVSDRAGVSASSASASPLSPSTSTSASISASTSCGATTNPRTVPRRVRFAALVLVADTSDDPDDSSNERFGERCSRSCANSPGGSDGGAGGDADLELGRGISAGDGGATAGTAVVEDTDWRNDREVRRGRERGFGAETGTGRSLGVETVPARVRALLVGLEGLGGGGMSCDVPSEGSSHTLGKPECGPRRLRIEEKCSQS